jgi:integrase/recombinase XerD
LIVVFTLGECTDSEPRNLKHKTNYKYRLTLRQLMKFGERHGIRYVKDFDTRTLQKFRASWRDKNFGALKKLQRLRSFFRFANLNWWIADNPASEIENPKLSMRPTLPFSPDEMRQILTAIAERIEECRPRERDNARRLRGLVLLLRYSGLRIGDAVSCSVDRLANGKIRLSTRKTGIHVHCPLPGFVVDELGAIPRRSKRHWFLTGKGKPQTSVTFWQGRLIDLFKRMKVTEFARTNKVTKEEARGSSKRWAASSRRAPRVVSATRLPSNSCWLEYLSSDSILLGDTSIRITERHYAPWVRERQEQEDADIERTWAQDPIALLESKRTPEIHRTAQL